MHNDPSIAGPSELAESTFKAEFPAVYEHLLQYKEELSNRNKAETGIRYEWYALQRWGANYMEDFYKQKIIWIELTDQPSYFIDEEGYFLNNTVFFMTGSRLHYILALLNSKVCEWHFTQIAATSGVGTKRRFKIYVEQICIPKNITAEKEEEIESLASKIQALKKSKKDTEELEQVLENRVCDLFGFTKVESDWIKQAI